MGGGLKPVTMPSRKRRLRLTSEGAIRRASDLGSVRSDQSFSVTKETPALVFWAPDRISNPDNETTPCTPGMSLIALSVMPPPSLVRLSDDAGGTDVTIRT